MKKKEERKETEQTEQAEADDRSRKNAFGLSGRSRVVVDEEGRRQIRKSRPRLDDARAASEQYLHSIANAKVLANGDREAGRERGVNAGCLAKPARQHVRQM